MPRVTQLGGNRRKDIEPLFEHDAPDEADDQFVIADARATGASRGRAAVRTELRVVDAARPHRDRPHDALPAQPVGNILRRGNNRIAPIVETTRDGDRRTLKKTEPVIRRIGLEQCVHRRNDRQPLPMARQRNRAMAEHVRAPTHGCSSGLNAAMSRRISPAAVRAPAGNRCVPGVGIEGTGDEIAHRRKCRRGRSSANRSCTVRTVGEQDSPPVC